MLFGEAGADEADERWAAREDADDIGAAWISLLSRSRAIWSRPKAVLHVADEALGTGLCLVDAVICRDPARGSPGGLMSFSKW